MTAHHSKSDIQGPAPARAAFYNDPTVRAIFWQVVVVGSVVALVGHLVSNALENLERQNIASGFGFLDLPAGFAIGEGMLPYSPADTYFRALLIGVLNTIKVAVAGIFFATIIGVIVGVARLSPNWLIARFATVYIETLRNVPLLVAVKGQSRSSPRTSTNLSNC